MTHKHTEKWKWNWGSLSVSLLIQEMCAVYVSKLASALQELRWAKVTCAVLEKTSYFYHNLRQLQMHLKHVKERCCYPLTLICLDAIGAVCHHFGFFIADLGRRVIWWLTSSAGASYNLANSRTRADCGSNSCGWGVCLFSLVYHFFLLSPSSCDIEWNTAWL